MNFRPFGDPDQRLLIRRRTPIGIRIQGTKKRPGETFASPGQAGAPATLPPTDTPHRFGSADGSNFSIPFPFFGRTEWAMLLAGSPLIRVSHCLGSRIGQASPSDLIFGPPETPALSFRRTLELRPNEGG
jgi:hypothetical protein